MGFSPDEQKKYDECLSALQSQEPKALAIALSTCLVFSPFMGKDLVERIIQDVKQNSANIRHNKRVRTYNNKLARGKLLVEKKRLSKAEQTELVKLAEDLGFDETDFLQEG